MVTQTNWHKGEPKDVKQLNMAVFKKFMLILPPNVIIGKRFITHMQRQYIPGHLFIVA